MAYIFKDDKASINGYTKTEFDQLLSTKANSSNVYTKAEIDAIFNNLSITRIV